ncbi:DNA/RNA non-specific endonuclease [Sphingomonas sp.]|uniref:DNA/RNA non-specific endonuclease n=1 Tax=Sphingomonas sp. TaxID=28214 RepID=UPI003AFFAD6E
MASDQQRSRNAQATAGGGNRLATDDGGHYVAVRFNGPTDTFNHFAQDANFNRGGYRLLEDG